MSTQSHPWHYRADRSLTDHGRAIHGFAPAPITYGPEYVPAPIAPTDRPIPVTRMRRLSAGRSAWFVAQAEMSGRVGPIGYSSQSVETDDSSDRFEMTDEQYRAETMAPTEDRQYGRAIAQRAATFLADAQPVIIRGRKSRGGVDLPDLATGKARTSWGEVIDLQTWADRILHAADMPTDRPDVPRLLTDPFTLSDRWEQSVRPDRVAWRGKRRARVRTHGRARIGGQTVSIAVTSRRYWPDAVTSDPGETIAWRAAHRDALNVELIGVDGAELVDIIRPWTLTAVTLPDRNQARRTARVTRRLNAVVSAHGSNMAPTDQEAHANALTSAYGRPATPWSYSARNLSRVIARAGLVDQANELAAIVRTSATDRPVTLVGATVSVRLAVVGKRATFLVDDGSHGELPVTEWCQRAALAGVTA